MAPSTAAGEQTIRSSECCVAEPEHHFANLLHENGPNNGVDVGDIEVYNDNANVYVIVTAPCAFDALQCYIGACAGLPAASSGYPNYVDPAGKVNIYTYVFPNIYPACQDICVGARVNGMNGGGEIEWEYACKHPQDCWLMPNGNILFCHATGALEMTREKQVVWEYKAGAKTEVHACQPLADGRVMLVECGPRDRKSTRLNSSHRT